MTMRTRGLAGSLAVLILAAGCSRVPRYIVSPAKDQTPPPPVRVIVNLTKGIVEGDAR